MCFSITASRNSKIFLRGWLGVTVPVELVGVLMRVEDGWGHFRGEADGEMEAYVYYGHCPYFVDTAHEKRPYHDANYISCT